jgi:O-antigen ligase
LTRPPGSVARARAVRVLDGAQSLGLVVLLVGLGTSEAAKSLGLALSALGFAGKILLGSRPLSVRTAAATALAAFFLSAVLSVALAAPGLGRPRELLTLATVLVVFPLTLDACRRGSRRILLGAAALSGAALAALLAYGAHMAGFYKRLVLPSIENAVPAGEYLAAACVLGIAVLVAERRSPVAGPFVGFAAGVSGIALGMTLSRGPLLGAAAGAVIAIGAGVRKWWVSAALVLCLVLAVWVFGALNPGARMVKEGVLGTRTASARLDTWRKTLDLIADRPLTGHGLGSYALLGVAYHDEIRGVEHQLNAHNVLLNTAAETGVIGCGTLLLFLVLGIRDVFRSVRRAAWSLDRAVLVGALAGSVAILVSGVFSVSIDAEPGILLFALLGVGASGRAGSEPHAGGGAP